MCAANSVVTVTVLTTGGVARTGRSELTDARARYIYIIAYIYI